MDSLRKVNTNAVHIFIEFLFIFFCFFLCVCVCVFLPLHCVIRQFSRGLQWVMQSNFIQSVTNLVLLGAMTR